jgi:hypothetical protein
MSQHKLYNTLPIMTLFGVVSALVITPFAFYRFANGQPVLGAIDLLIVFSICIGVFHAWRSGRTEGASLFIVLVYNASCVVLAHVGELPVLLWVFPMLLANFLLIGRAPAVAISAFAAGGDRGARSVDRRVQPARHGIRTGDRDVHQRTPRLAAGAAGVRPGPLQADQ